MGDKRTVTETNRHPLVRRWRWVAGLAVLGAVIAIGYTAWVPAKYRVRAQVLMLPQSDVSVASSMLLSGNTATPLTILQGVFDSDAMTAALAKQFDMTESSVRSIWFVRTDPLAQQLEILADSTSPQMARQMVDFSIRKAREFELAASESAASARQEQLARSLSKQSAGNKSVEAEMILALQNADAGAFTLENSQDVMAQLIAAKARRAALGDRLAGNLGDADLPKDGRLDTLRIRVRNLSNELKTAKEKFGPEAPALTKIQDQLDVATEQYSNELGLATQAIRGGVQSEIAELDATISALSFRVSEAEARAESAPTQNAAVLTTTRKLEQAYATTADLRLRFEQARVDAEVERVNWTVVTPAFLEERSINKRWARNPAAGAILGMLLAAFLAYSVPHRPKRAKAQPTPEGETEWPNAA